MTTGDRIIGGLKNPLPELFNKRVTDKISLEDYCKRINETTPNIVYVDVNNFMDKVANNVPTGKDIKFVNTPLSEGTTTKPPISDTNPKQAIGSSKLPLYLWSPLASAYGCLGLMNGKKYGYGNFKATPIIASIYISALKRHLSAWEEGQELDVDGVPHLSAILANVAILLESRSVGTLIDDRNIQGGYLKEIDELTKIANKINQIHKDTYHHYTIKDNPPTAIK